MRRTLIFMVLAALLYAVPTKAQNSTALTLAVANKQLAAEKADLQSQVNSLTVRLEMAQARITELEKGASKAQPQQVVVTVQPDPSTVRANDALAKNLRLQSALAISNAFKTPAPQIQPINTARTCTSSVVGNQIQTVCQ